MQKLAAALVLALALGCASRPVTRLTFVTTREAVVEPEILEAGVERGWCYTLTPFDYLFRLPWRTSLVPDYGYAVALVLKSVPGANVMTNVVVERRRSEYGLFRRVCSYVTGDAGRVP